MPILWIVVYCLIAVSVLFTITWHCETLDEKTRCDGLVKAARERSKKPAGNDVSPSA